MRLHAFPSLDPIVRVALHGGEDLAQLRYMAEKRLKQEFETVKGVGYRLKSRR